MLSGRAVSPTRSKLLSRSPTYSFLKRLDEQEIAEELKANREKKPMQKRFFPEGKDSKKRSFQDYRWNRFKNTDSRDMYAVDR
jgi:type I restriction enzyme M protein